ncbi:MAG: hypothetical protein MAG431_01037 [Chloroflexi bacterium]|nr:hypothetical protein [Chloroflexota bacterium]
MTKNQLGIVIVLIGMVWAGVCLLADVFGLGPLIFGFSKGSAIGPIQLVFIFIGVFIALIGVAVMVLVEDKKE